jgi:hypothetical protein
MTTKRRHRRIKGQSPPRGPGRPSTYTEALGQEICERLGNGESLLAVCRSDHMPNANVVWQWLDSGKNPQFTSNFARARIKQSHSLVSEALDIMRDEKDSKRAYLAKAKCDVLLQVAARLNPAEYSERWNQLLINADGGPMAVNVIALIPPPASKTGGNGQVSQSDQAHPQSGHDKTHDEHITTHGDAHASADANASDQKQLDQHDTPPLSQE